VSLSARSDSGSVFAGWSGACSGTGACTVTLDTAKTVTARFNLIVTYTLTVRKTPVGQVLGSVTSTPAGINCGLLCTSASATFPSGTVVTLNTEAGLGRLQEWTGDCKGGGACVLTMDADKGVVAHFILQPTLAPIEANPKARPVMESTLSVPRGRAEVSANGRTIVVDAAAAAVRMEARGGDNLVEGVVREAAGGGLWRFDFGPMGVESGTVTVFSGDPVTATPSAVVFRLKGRPGERVSFVLHLPRGGRDAIPLPR
jgi:Divergent InlB B-repeat domain